MNWIDFPYIAYTAVMLLTFSFTVFFFPVKKKIKYLLANILSITAILLFAYFITSLWVSLERPPLRTLGETRLWYAVFLPILGLITFNRWKYFWFLAYSNLLAVVFILINLSHPETYNKTLMPALQSPWFVPHVIVYILSYAVLSVSWLVAIKGLTISNSKLKGFAKNVSILLSPFYFLIQLFSEDEDESSEKVLKMADNIVFIGFAFLTLGILFGALWAKEAWGNYWTWDPKETWALLTFLVYLIYIHIRTHHKDRTKMHLRVLSISFIFLLAAWFGVNYMPSAKNSVHTYSQQE
ncbi:MAG: cytochrome c biogenesis protein CcsA [Bacteroidales bacterium]|nr:cytochrome c biogenesis protein CcsA [Bacteroidales bacterium]